MVWSNCWTGLVTAHELTHTMGAVQPTAPHKTDKGHCWDGQDDMCYADGSKQKQRLVCKGPTPTASWTATVTTTSRSARRRAPTSPSTGTAPSPSS